MTYAEFKSIVTRKNLAWQYDDRGTSYRIFAADGVILHECELHKDPAQVAGLSSEEVAQAQADLAEFEAVYKPVSNFASGVRLNAFATPDFEFNGDGLTGVCLAGQTLNLDYTFPGVRYISGGMLFLEGSEIGDWAEFMVLDANGIIPEPYRVAFPDYPVIKDWVNRWFVPRVPVGGTSPLLSLQTPYAGKIDAGLVLRMIYHSTGETDVKMSINYFLHRPL